MEQLTEAGAGLRSLTQATVPIPLARLEVLCQSLRGILHHNMECLKQGYRACVETRFSWLEIERDHDPLQNSGVSIFAESPVRESADLAFLI